MVESSAFFIDKTLFIKDFMESGDDVSVILRPRRFGKSTNINMLQSFLSVSESFIPSKNSSCIKSFFDGCLIGQDTEFMSRHFRQYPVALLRLKDCTANTWKGMKHALWLCIRNMYTPHLAQLSGAVLLQGYDFDSVYPPSWELMGCSLMILTELLFKEYRKRVIVLVDEYDSPLNSAAQGGFYAKASEFFSRFFSKALKDNYYLERACLIGIAEVKGSNIPSSLNNMVVYSVDETRYSAYFGLTVEEIRNYVQCNETISNILAWYNGYTIGGVTIINTWSFLSCLVRGKFRSYWIDTTFTGSVKSVLEPHMQQMLLRTFQLLFSPEPVPVPAFSSQVDYSLKSMNVVKVLHFLVLTGYLAYCPKNQFVGLVRIPNYEVREHWKECIVDMVRNTVLVQASLPQTRLQESLTACPFVLANLREDMRRILYSSISYIDAISESSYHCFFLGCFQSALDGLYGFSVRSNRESGKGRFDIAIAIEGLSRVFIFELKKADSLSTLETKAVEALKQAIDRDYVADYSGYQCYYIGVAFFQKDISELMVEVLNV